MSSFVEHGSKFLCPESFLCKVAGNRIIGLIWGFKNKNNNKKKKGFGELFNIRVVEHHCQQ